MSAGNVRAIIDELRRTLSDAAGEQELLDRTLVVLAEYFPDSRPAVYLRSGKELLRAPVEAGTAELEADTIVIRGVLLNQPLIVSDLRRSMLPDEQVSLLSSAGICSIAAMPIYLEGRTAGAIEISYATRYHRFTGGEARLLEHLAEILTLHLSRIKLAEVPVANPASASTPVISDATDLPPLLEIGKLIVLRTQPNLEISSVQGDVEGILGMSSKEIVSEPSAWKKFLHPESLTELTQMIREMGDTPSGLSTEIRVVNRQTGETRWLLLRAMPRYSPDGQDYLGWDGFGVDISAQRRTEEELIAQSKRIEALYTVSRSLVVNMDPALVTLKGLRALLTATKSDAGMGFFFQSRSKKLELVASEGLSAKYVEGVLRSLDDKTLVRYTAESKEGLLLEDIQQDSRALVDIARQEGLRSTIVVPLIFEAEVLGVIVLFCRTAGRYGEADFDLVSAAASQIALALKQAELYATERRQADSLGALYRLSHELTKVQAPRDVAEHAFPILQEEFSFKRIWLGVINDQGTHIIGQGGLGPGIRRNVVNIQIELDLRHDFLDEAIRTKQPVIVPPEREMECSGLNRLIRRINPGMFVVVPLVALGQVVGVFVGEPSVASAVVLERKLQLLTSMASEIASVILARRFELRLANSEKMRMAGMLASGVAHNFNNMLQAVMGQASLIEMQLPESSPLRGSARTIIESTNKGAGLVRQLLSFSMEGSSVREVLSLNQLLEDSRVLYESLLGSEVTLELDLEPALLSVSGDQSQIQQLVTNLLANAREAVESGDGGYVKISTRQLRLRSGEVDPELAPGNYVRIDVEDDGIGMDEEKQLRCFEPFFTTKNVDTGTGLGFEGTGLGLSTAYSLARQHDGVITVRSAIGEGTVFSIYLPLAPTLVRERTDVSGVSAERPKGPLEAVVFNLEADSLTPVKSALESLGFRIYTVTDKAQVLKTLTDRSDSISLLVMDIDRSGPDPMIFIQNLTKTFTKLRILSTSVDDTRWAALLKPFRGVDLAEKPIGVWAVHSVAKKIVAAEVRSLDAQVTTHLEGNGKAVAPEVVELKREDETPAEGE